ncbi:MAG: alpha/beta hydrolase [Rhodobacteraceae bacterium]|nr:alpha/beta hydrolase [Paracoccaceae bacterium]
MLTWDYRDFGASGSPRGSTARMSDWVLRDPVSVRAAMRTRFPGLPVWVIGHSLGGMAVGFQDDIGSVERVITVAAGHGHFSDHPPSMKVRAWLLWHVLGPLSTTLLGYLPARRLGLGQDLPKGVFWQWRKWLLDRGALPADPDLGGLRQPGIAGPLTTIAIEDDDMLPPATVHKMAAWHPAATIEYRLLRPADHGLPRIGHIHPFHSRNAVLWPSMIA